MIFKQHQLLAAAFVAVTALSGPAFGEGSWPSKPVRVIVPIAAGGVTDVVVRAMSRDLSQRLGQTFVVDNRPGANGVIGGEVCAKATPDGYTVCVVNTGITSVNPLVYEKLPFDPAKDYVPVANLYFLTGAVVVPASLPINTVAELRAAATGKRGAVNFGTIGPGSYPEMFLTWLNREWKTAITGVPYKGGGPVAIALISGEVQVSAAALGNFIGQLKAGQLKALAVSGQKRSRLLPQVPTYADAGLGSFKGHMWWGMVAPTGTPSRVISRLNQAIVEVFKQPRFGAFLESQAAESVVDSPQAFATFLEADREWTKKLLVGARRK